MNDERDVVYEVRAIAARLAGRPVESIRPDEPIFGEGLDLDSRTIVALLASIEDTFGVSLPDADLDLTSLRRIDTLARLVASLHADRLRQVAAQSDPAADTDARDRDER